MTPVCENAVPWLDYEVATDVTADPTVTLTFVDPESLGRDIVITDLPSSGRLPWPGAALDADDQPIDWPGWRLDGDVWVEDDSDAWVRGPLTVHVEMGGETDVVVSYPAATDACAATPDGAVSPGTGTNPTPTATDAPNGGAGAGAATPPPTSTVSPDAPTSPTAPALILAILAAIFAGSLAAAGRAPTGRRS